MFPCTRLVPLLVAIPLVAPASRPAQDATTLKWHFTAGEVLRYRMTTDQETEMSMMPGGGMKLRMDMVMNESVREVADDGTATMDVSYEALRMNSDNPMMPIHYDSTQPSSESKTSGADFTKALDAMLKAKFQMKMDPTGKVTEVKGIDELLASITANLPKMPGAGGADMMKQMFGEPSLRKMVEVNVFPAGPLSAGATWSRSFDIPSPMIGTMKFAMDNKFAGLEDHAGQSCAKIEITTKVSLEKGAASDSSMKFDFTMEDSDGTTTQWFSIKAGRMLEAKTDMDMSMKMAMPSQGGADEKGMTMEISTSTGMHMLLIGKDDPAFEPEKKKAEPAKK